MPSPFASAPDVRHLAGTSCPQSMEDLGSAILASACSKPDCSFDMLWEAIRRTDGFMEHTLPFIWEEAVRASVTWTPVPWLVGEGEVILTQEKCLGILANAFLCTFPGRVSRNCLSGPGLPSINFDELFEDGSGSEAAKLQMIFHYFERCRLRRAQGDSLVRPLRIARSKPEASSPEDWSRSTEPLLPLTMAPLHASMDETKGMLRVDFANQIIGGAAIAYGNVQEEIMFCVSPELIATRLFCPVMEKDEAILVEGAERYSEPVGYGWDLGFGGPFTDMSPVVHGRSLDSWVVAIDASDFRGGNRNSQFEPAGIIRELNKAWAGFSMPGAPDRIATGNWGCGLFKGDVELKSILQWLAASRAGRAIHYHPWNEERVYRELPPLAERLCASRITVGEVTRALLGGVAPRRCYTQLRDTYAAT